MKIYSNFSRRGVSFRTIAMVTLSIGFFAAALMLSTTPVQAAKYTMTISHIYPEDFLSNEEAPSIERFRQVVEAATNGAGIRGLALGRLGLSRSSFSIDGIALVNGSDASLCF